MIQDICALAAGNFQTISVLAYYSHLVPIAIGLLLAFYTLFKSRFSKLSVIFSFFTFSFCLWLTGDLITWVVQNYYQVYFFWSWLDFVNLAFFALGVYFFGIVGRGKISIWEKIILVLIATPIFFIGVTTHSVSGFYEPWCNAINNSFETNYNIYAEIAYCVLLSISLVIAWVNSRGNRQKRSQVVVIGLATLLFFLVFGITEYLSSSSAVYNINLYGLFVLPVFLIAMAFSISNLGLFQLRFLGTQLLAYILLIIIGSQLLVVQDVTDRNLVFLTLVIALFIAYLLLRNTNREIDARGKIEKLAGELEESNKGQENLIHVMNHQIKGYLAKDRNVFSELLADGEYGTINDMGKAMIQQGFESATKGIDFVQDILKGSSAQKGTLPYNMQAIDFKKVVTEVVEAQRKSAEDKGLTFEFTANAGDYGMTGDPTHLGEAVRNLIDNSINYTQKGSISMSLNRSGNKIVFMVKDTGVGINNEDKTKLFTQGGRGRESSKINVNSTGYGLVFVKSVAEAHKGRVWADSLGTGHGSTFTLELPAGK